MTETVAQRRFVGAWWFVWAVIGLVLAYLTQPVADWGFFGVVLGAVTAALGLVGLWMLATGKGRIVGRSASVETQRTFAYVGIVAVTVIVIASLLADWANWTAADVLTITIWVALGAMFVASISITNRAIKGS